MNNKTSIFARILSTLFVLCIFIIPLITNAQLGYTPLTDIPDLTNQNAISQGGNVDLTTFLGSAYTFTLSAAVVLAILMITVGGFQWLTSAGVGSVDAAKDRIRNAIYGLLLAFCTYLIVNTINPAALNFNVFNGNSNTGTNSEEPVNNVNKYAYSYTDILTGQPATKSGLELKQCQDAVNNLRDQTLKKYIGGTCAPNPANAFYYTYDELTSPNTNFSSIDPRTTYTHTEGPFLTVEDCDVSKKEKQDVAMKRHYIHRSCFESSIGHYRFEYTFGGNPTILVSPPTNGPEACKQLEQKARDTVDTYRDFSLCESPTASSNYCITPTAAIPGVSTDLKCGFETETECLAGIAPLTNETINRYSNITSCNPAS